MSGTTTRARTASHWAARLIGVPYRRGAEGPDAYDCWGLVRAALRLRNGCELPSLSADGRGVHAIVSAARAAGWRPVLAGAADGDVLRMRHVASGWSHVGLAVAPGPAVQLLHASEADGRVCLVPLASLPGLGFADICVWRQA